MKIALGCVAFVFSLSCSAQGNTLASDSKPSIDPQSTNNKAARPRLKISVALEDSKQLPNISIGNISICSKKSCYRPNILRRDQNTAGLNILTATDTDIPASQIESISFEKLKDSNVVGTVKLARTLELDKGYYGGEIFVTLKQDLRKKEVEYQATYAASSYLTEKGHSVYYNPRFPLDISLSHGVTLEIPQGSLTLPEIFHVAIHDTGKEFPLVEIYPVVNLKKESTIRAEKIQRTTTNSNSSTPVVTGPPPVSMSSRFTPKPSNTGKSELLFRTTGRLKLSSAFGSTSNTAAMADVNECANMLANPSNQEYIRNLSAQNGMVLIDWCEDIYPYVHIGWINAHDYRLNFNVPYKRINHSAGWWYELKRLPDLTAAKGGFGINGFTWTGDVGDGPGQNGIADGYLTYNNLVMGNNIVGGGTNGSGSAGQKYVIGLGPINLVSSGFGAWDAGRYTQVGFDFPSLPHQFSSSTSIVHQSVCTGAEGRTSLWSAIGVGNGQIVLVSSAGSSVVDSNLCSIFTAFGQSSAIRLDGGPSTAMTSGSVLLNPLPIIYQFQYGNGRYIGYGLQFHK
jgi:hypothetical protein